MCKLVSKVLDPCVEVAQQPCSGLELVGGSKQHKPELTLLESCLWSHESLGVGMTKMTHFLFNFVYIKKQNKKSIFQYNTWSVEAVNKIRRRRKHPP